MGIGVWGWYHLAFFGVFLPYVAVRSRRRLEEHGYPPRKAFFVSVILQQAIFATMSLIVAYLERIPLFPPRLPAPQGVLLAGLFLAGSIVAMRPLWRDAVARREPRVQLSMPADAGERRLWVGVSVAAGIGEEISYRGVMYTLLLRLAGDPLTAALGAAAVFGASHIVQGWKAVWITAVFALAAQGLTLYSGSLYLAMAWHVGYDIVAGLTYGRLGRELGFPAPQRSEG
jgi:membrane protease YdiL (CAAX protease family)